MKIVIVADNKSLKKLPSSKKPLLEGCHEMFDEFLQKGNLIVQCPQSLKNKIKHFIPNEIISTEPIKKGTAPAIGLAATRIFHESPDENLSIVYSDHPVSYKDKLLNTLKSAEVITNSLKKLTLIGVNPTFPSTKYGYIKIGKTLQEMNGTIAFEMVDFCEKPTKKKAHKFLSSWRYLWNSGYMISSAKNILQLFKDYLPDIHKGLMMIKESIGTGLEDKIARTVFEDFKSTSIDKGIYEKIDTSKICVIPVDLGVHDFEV